MINTPRPLVAVPEAGELEISPLSPFQNLESQHSDITDYKTGLGDGYFDRNTYHEHTDTLQDTPNTDTSDGASRITFPHPIDELGISRESNAGFHTAPLHSYKIRRVPVGQRHQYAPPPTLPNNEYQPQERPDQKPKQLEKASINSLKSSITNLFSKTPLLATNFKAPRKESLPLKNHIPMGHQSASPEYLMQNAAPIAYDPAPNTPQFRATDQSRAYNSPLDSAVDLSNEGYDDEIFYNKYHRVPMDCSSRTDIHTSRSGWMSVTILILSVYSTIMSGIWLVVALLQPKWGRGISSSFGLAPSTATLLTTLFAKTIEMSFVAVFIACIGQVFSRRALVRNSRGVTLAEISMRNFVIQPGLLITHFKSLPYSATTILGAMCILATLGTMFYTTASDAMVSPKLKYGNWEPKQLSSYVMASYANAPYIKKTCPSLLGDIDELNAAESCVNVDFSGDSYRNLITFMSLWNSVKENGSSIIDDIAQRPVGRSLLHGNTTLTGSWIETQHSNVAAHFEKFGRIVNNVTLAMPHPGVHAAAMAPVNRILQPNDLAGVGEYKLKAAVVSPSVNVLCVEVSSKDIAPLVYTEWPHSRTEKTGVGEQEVGVVDWQADVPGKEGYLNRTVVDDIFKWGPKHERLPPVFPLYPSNFNFVVNSTSASDAIYLLGKNAESTNFTLCEMRSWLSPNCSTRFISSGLGGSSMGVNCEDNDDETIYLRPFPDQLWPAPSIDWKWIADQWKLSLDLNGGASNNNASNSRILTQLALNKPKLPSYLPSLAEALAIFASSTVISSAIDTPFRHYWEYDRPNNILDAPGILHTFNASISAQAYSSGHVERWQGIFYIILVIVFGINLFCLSYFVMRSGIVTDFTEPLNMFALALNSPPSAQIYGSCGAGPKDRDLVVPWRVAYAPSTNHYFFEEANDTPWKGRYANDSVSTSAECTPNMRNASYKRLSAKRGWL